MQSSKWNVLAIIGMTFTLVFICLVLQYNAAANSVAVFQAEGITSENSLRSIKKVLGEKGGVSSVRVDPAKGIVIADFDSRAVDPRTIAAAMTRAGFQTRIIDLLTMKQYTKLVSGGAGCGSAGCGDCSESR